MKQSLVFHMCFVNTYIILWFNACFKTVSDDVYRRWNKSTTGQPWFCCVKEVNGTINEPPSVFWASRWSRLALSQAQLTKQISANSADPKASLHLLCFQLAFSLAAVYHIWSWLGKEATEDKIKEETALNVWNHGLYINRLKGFLSLKQPNRGREQCQ